MQSCSGAAYVSKKYMQAYQEKKAKRQSKMAKKAKKLDKIKEVDEEMMKTNQSQQNENKMKDESSSSEDSDEYDRNNRSCEEVHSDDLEGELDHSDEEGDQEKVKMYRGARKMERGAYKMGRARRFRQELDTNIFKIGFQTLANDAEFASGDPTVCEKCKAFFNINSKIEEEKSADHEESQVWICEFCNHKNPIEMDDEEKPKNKAVNYILEAAAQVQDKKAQGKQDISVIFCIDQSGSMCCSQPIQGKHKLKGDRSAALREFMKFSDGSDQRMDREQKNVTYISRMQCLQAAIDQQIGDMSNGASNRKLGIVAFNNEVTVFGDGSQDPLTIGGDKLNDQQFLLATGAKCGQERMKLSVKDSSQNLQKQLMSIEETGATALGPAVATSIAMAANSGIQGSQVVICTDGLANIGLGSFDEIITDEEKAGVDKYYISLGEFAKENGVTINVISIIGDDCNLDTLSKLAEMTGGEVERVNPVELTNNFANILSQPIIASNVVAKVKIHKGLTFRNEDPNNLSKDDSSLMTRDIGNVTADTEITFEYTMKKISDLVKMDDIDLSTLKELPFQVQITYKALNGSKCIRVITEQQSISNNRQQLEQRANFNVVATNTAHQSAKMSKFGNVRHGQAMAKGWNRKMKAIPKTQAQERDHQTFKSNFGACYKAMNMQEDRNQKSIAESFGQNTKVAFVPKPEAKAEKKAKKSSLFALDEDDGMSDAEDNAIKNDTFGASFNQKPEDLAKNAAASKRSSSFLGGLFSGMMNSSVEPKDSNMKMESSKTMAIGSAEQFKAAMKEDKLEDLAAEEEEEWVENDPWAQPIQRIQQNDECARELHQASKYVQR